MEAGAPVWVRDDAQGWVSGTITKKTTEGDVEKLAIAITDDDLVAEAGVREVTIPATETETDDVKRRDPTATGTADLINLPVLHEPAIVHALELRYAAGTIYTFNGSILIAVNPFQRLKLYTTEILEAYYNNGLLRSQGIDSLPMNPHVYTIADAAYRDMANLISMGGKLSDASQSILISGESGAGKTETTKIVMRYLTVVGGGREIKEAEEAPAGEASVMERVLQSNPILEAFGNARTVRNDNSSRFGKFIELKFDDRGVMRGAAIDTYLLEKIRLPTHAAGERNFHVFYQLHSTMVKTTTTTTTGAAVAEANVAVGAAAWGLAPSPATHYHYLAQGGVPTLETMDDGEEFCLMTAALKTLGFADGERRDALALVAALIHLGEVVFEYDAGDDGGGSKVDEGAAGELRVAAELTALPPDALLAALTTRHVKTRSEEYTVRLVPADAHAARDAVAKALYGRLFEWLVEKINAGIAVEEANETTPSSTTVAASIGVLDIFGFECFATNSFEQLCINYTNETLQQQFNRYVFKLEQEEYAREQITWSFIEFPDNQDCLDLIEGSRRQVPPDGGLLLMLDDEARLPKGSDANYAARVLKSLGGSQPRLTASRKQTVDGVFEVRHYAGPVAYKVAGFLEKNKDELPRDAEALFVRARDAAPLIAAISDAFDRSRQRQAVAAAAAKSPMMPTPPSSDKSPSTNNNNNNNNKPVTVGSQFKAQLGALMRTVSATKPHYIRCLKPNDKNAANQFWRQRVAEQLRYGGVLEAVRVARSGFPVRLPHAAFVRHYGCLGPVVVGGKKEAVCAASLARTAADACGFAVEEVQLGKTKVFLRKTAHDVLEARRSLARTAAATKVGANVRMWLKASSSARVRAAARVLVGFFRRAAAYRARRSLTRGARTTRLATAARRRSAERRYGVSKRGATALAAQYRGVRARASAWHLRRDKAATAIQATVRRGKAVALKTQSVKAWTTLQSRHVRRRMARAALFRLRKSALDVGRLQAEQEAMKDEIARLRSAAAAASRKRDQEEAAESREEVERLRAELEATKQRLQDEGAAALQAAKKQCGDLVKDARATADEHVAALRAALGEEQAKVRALEEDLQAATDHVAEGDRLNSKLEHDLSKALALASAAAMNNDHPAAVAAVAAAVATHDDHRAHHAPRAAAAAAASSSHHHPRPPALDGVSGDDGEASTPGAVGGEDHHHGLLRAGAQVTMSEDGVPVGEPVTLRLASIDGEGFTTDLEPSDPAPAKSDAALTFAPRSRNVFKRKRPPAALRVADLSAIANEEDRGLKITVLVSTQESRRVLRLHFASDHARDEAHAALRALADLPTLDRHRQTHHRSSPRAAAAAAPSLAATTAAATMNPPPPPPPSSSPPHLGHHQFLDHDAVAELEKQLLLERANNQKMMLQMLEMQQDVNRSSAKIVELKQESAGLRSQLVARDRMHADDARMRLQLGKRLQQLVFDNAALRRTADDQAAQLAKRF